MIYTDSSSTYSRRNVLNIIVKNFLVKKPSDFDSEQP